MTIVGEKTTTYEAVGDKEFREKSGDDDAAKRYQHAMGIYRKHAPRSVAEVTLIALFVALTVLCWGAYGPVLHKGQMKMAGSRLRPLSCGRLACFSPPVAFPSILRSGVL